MTRLEIDIDMQGKGPGKCHAEMGSVVNDVQMERFSRVACALAEKKIEGQQR